MRRRGRRALTGLLAGLLLAPLVSGASAGAAPSDPSQWPDDLGLDPELTATPHTIRFSGADRYGTNLAMSLALRGKGNFPFSTSDRTSNNAPTLAAASGWWGAGSCPRSIIVVAGDTFADALAASSLSDPTDLGNQPLLRRVAAADPSFDPIGGMDRVDTASAPIVVTASGRSGASALSRTAVTTATDLARGGCTTAREAILVGGPRAVPTEVEKELLGLGFREVFRVAGADRYETAANVAIALGTEALAPGVGGCSDPNQTDGSTQLGFYGNAVAEFRLSPTECRLLPRSVVLADGLTGADALAAGWWTSRWQVPVVLTGPDGALPEATKRALSAIEIESLIVLGGVGRIPETVVNEAKGLASAVAGRIAGSDRYGTSVEMAKAFGGWHQAGGFSAEMLCVAASSGNGADSQGWPDALAAGPWCARMSVSGRVSPTRVLPSGATAGGARPAHDAAPILLVQVGAETLPPPVADFLAGAPFALASQPFAVVFGGQSGLSASAERRLDVALGKATEPDPQPPGLREAWGTRLDLAPAFQTIGTGSRRLCLPAGGASNFRWLSLTQDPGRTRFLLEHGATPALAPSGRNIPLCLAHDGATPLVSLAAVGHGGAVSPVSSFDFEATRGLSLSTEVRQSGEQSTEATGARIIDLTGAMRSSVTVREGTRGGTAVAAELHVRVLPPAEEGGTSSFEGSAGLVANGRRISIAVAGTAIVTASLTELRGHVDAVVADGTRFRGGFRATISGGSAEPPDGRWLLDGLPV